MRSFHHLKGGLSVTPRAIEGRNKKKRVHPKPQGVEANFVLENQKSERGWG